MAIFRSKLSPHGSIAMHMLLFFSQSVPLTTSECPRAQERAAGAVSSGSSTVQSVTLMVSQQFMGAAWFKYKLQA